MPGVPDSPGGPVGPVSPSRPCRPCGPATPGRPAKPLGPLLPGFPRGPGIFRAFVGQSAGRAGPIRPVNAELLQDRIDADCAAAMPAVTVPTTAKVTTTVASKRTPKANAEPSCPARSRSGSQLRVPVSTVSRGFDGHPPAAEIICGIALFIEREMTGLHRPDGRFRSATRGAVSELAYRHGPRIGACVAVWGRPVRKCLARSRSMRSLTAEPVEAGGPVIRLGRAAPGGHRRADRPHCERPRGRGVVVHKPVPAGRRLCDPGAEGRLGLVDLHAGARRGKPTADRRGVGRTRH